MTLNEKIKDLKREDQSRRVDQSQEVEEAERSNIEMQKQVKALQDLVQKQERELSQQGRELENRIRETVAKDVLEKEDLLKSIEKMKIENARSIESLNKTVEFMKAENSRLRGEIARGPRILLDKEGFNTDKVTELKLRNRELEMKNEEIHKELKDLKSNSNLFNNTLQENLIDVRAEKNQLLGILQHKKLKCKNKTKQLEDDLKMITFDREKLLMNEKLLKDRLDDAELKVQKQKEMGEEKIAHIQKDSEQDIKKLRNELELRGLQLVSLHTEKENLQKKINEYKDAADNIEDHMSEIDRENKLTSLQQENDEMKEVISELKEEMLNTNHRVRIETEMLRNQKTHLEEEIRLLKDGIYSWRTMNLGVRSEKSELEIQHMKLAEENRSLKDALNRQAQLISNQKFVDVQRNDETNFLKAKKAKGEIEKLRAERDKLIEISNGLSSKLNQHREKIKQYEAKAVESNGALERLAELEAELNLLKEKENERVKQMTSNFGNYGENIDTSNISRPNELKKDLGGVDKYKSRIENIHKELYVKSSQKPLYEIGSAHISNSHKATVSQKEAKIRLRSSNKNNN